MRCSKAQEYLSLKMDNGLPPDATVDLEQHVDACGSCRQYRDDLLLGRRLLQATEPSLSENFDWRLQLRLKQTLNEAAGQAAFPWEERPRDRWRWLGNFGAAAAVGLAAVLAFAVFIGPMESDQSGSPRVAGEVAEQPAIAADQGDRLPLIPTSGRGSGLYFNPGVVRTVSSGSSNQLRGSDSFNFNRGWQAQSVQNQGWSGQKLEDLRTINRLKNENRFLTNVLFQTQLQMRNMRAQLDTTDTNALDLKVQE